MSSQQMRPPNLLAEEDLGLFSPPSSPEAPALEERKVKKSRVLPKMEATPQNSSSYGSASGSSSKSSSSPSKPAKGGDSWECEIDDLLGDDSDEEVGWLLHEMGTSNKILIFHH